MCIFVKFEQKPKQLLTEKQKKYNLDFKLSNRIIKLTLICIIFSGQSFMAAVNHDSNPFAKFLIDCVNVPLINSKLLHSIVLNYLYNKIKYQIQRSDLAYFLDYHKNLLGIGRRTSGISTSTKF